MSKRRRTKKQKLRSESRRNQLSSNTDNQKVETSEKEHIHVTHSIAGITLPSISTPTHSASDKKRYSYVVRDVRNTFTILAIIVAANLVLYLLIQQGMIKITW